HVSGGDADGGRRACRAGPAVGEGAMSELPMSPPSIRRPFGSPMRVARLAPLILSVGLFAASLPFGTFADERFPDQFGKGIECLMIGWLGVFDGIFAWYANPLLLAAWIFMPTRMRIIPFVLALLAMLFALTFFGNTEIAINEAGHHAKIIGYGLG